MSFDYIGTYTNKKVHFMNPSVEEFCIEDIANALSKNCRYNGHVGRFYSVAEHSVLMADKVFEATGDKDKAFSALMHDASEAYLCDIPRPIKPYLTNYEDIERGLELKLQEAFGYEDMCEYGKWLDNNIVRDEAEQLFMTVPDWVSYYEEVGVAVCAFAPASAEKLFIDTFNKYKEK